MPRRPGRDVAVGTLFALALVILALGIMAIGGESRLFVEKAKYRIVFPSADGLSAGSPVKMAGVQVGAVSDIELPVDPADSGIMVSVGVDQAYAARVRQDSTAKLRVLLYVSGEKFVEITPGSLDSPPLAPGSQIPLAESREILQQGEDIAENLSEITVSLRNILRSLEQGEGLLGQMLKDPKFGEAGLEALRGTLENTQRITADVLRLRRADFHGESVVGRLLYDEALGAKFDDLGRAIGSLSAVLQAVERREGALGELLREGGPAQQALLDLSDSAASLKRLTAQLESSEGLLGRLLTDKEYAEAVSGDLRAMLADLREISGKVNRGEGSLGALINERVLHDSAEDVVAGVNDSKFARWLLRRYRKKGIEAAEGAEPQQPEREPPPPPAGGHP